MKVLITDPISESGISILEDANLKVIQLYEASNSEKIKACEDIDGWIIRSGTSIDKKFINIAKKLRIIGRAGVGVDNIDIGAATRNGIVVMNTPDVNTISAAEHTVAMMLALSRNISIGDFELKQKKWNRHLLIGSELRNKTLGIVGLGKIGREIMIRCLSFGMKIIGYDPFVNQNMLNREEIEIVELDELTKNSDFITIHVPLNDDTRDLFNYKRLKAMKKTARIINVSRGGIINESDLAKSLIDKEITGAAIDVYTQEDPKPGKSTFCLTRLGIFVNLISSRPFKTQVVSYGIGQMMNPEPDGRFPPSPLSQRRPRSPGLGGVSGWCPSLGRQSASAPRCSPRESRTAPAPAPGTPPATPRVADPPRCRTHPPRPPQSAPAHRRRSHRPRRSPASPASPSPP